MPRCSSPRAPRIGSATAGAGGALILRVLPTFGPLEGTGPPAARGPDSIRDTPTYVRSPNRAVPGRHPSARGETSGNVGTATRGDGTGGQRRNAAATRSIGGARRDREEEPHVAR